MNKNILGIETDSPEFMDALRSCEYSGRIAGHQLRTFLSLKASAQNDPNNEIITAFVTEHINTLVFKELERSHNAKIRRMKASNGWKNFVASVERDLGIDYSEISPKDFRKAQGMVGGAIVKRIIEQFIEQCANE